MWYSEDYRKLFSSEVNPEAVKALGKAKKLALGESGEFFIVAVGKGYASPFSEPVRFIVVDEGSVQVAYRTPDASLTEWVDSNIELCKEGINPFPCKIKFFRCEGDEYGAQIIR